MERENVQKMVTIREIADTMQYSLQTVRILVKEGAFPRVHRAKHSDGRLGHPRIYLSDFEKWRKESTRGNDEQKD